MTAYIMVWSTGNSTEPQYVLEIVDGTIDGINTFR